jgi:hypothetical protein
MFRRLMMKERFLLIPATAIMSLLLLAPPGFAGGHHYYGGNYYGGHHYHHGGNEGAYVAGALVGGLILGTVIGSVVSQQRYVPAGQVYAYPEPTPAAYGNDDPPGQWVQVPGRWINGRWVPSHRVWVPVDPY